MRCRAAPLLALLFLALLLAAAVAAAPDEAAAAQHAAGDAATADDPTVASAPDTELDDEDDIQVEDDEDDDEDDDDDDADDADDEEDVGDEPEDPPAAPDAPATLDPPGEENASGFAAPTAVGALFFDDFQSGLSKWTHTSNPEYGGMFKLGQGVKPTFKGDRALIIPEKARKYGLSAKVDGLADPSTTDVVVQYEVKLDQGMTCGGAYVKLPTMEDFDPASFNGETTYSIMFGPDKCGATDKVHFIFQSKNPVTGKMTEHHLKEPPSVANTYDKKTHLYTLAVKSDGKFELSIDDEVKKDGTLADAFEPPVQPPEEIDDPDDKKPEDWVDEAKIPDPEATKPDDWDEDAPKEIEDADAVKPDNWLDDEPEKIPDPEASQPEEWDDEEDGTWEADLVANPKCEEAGCGKWNRPMKPNPDYKGKWTAPMIDNPKYIGVWMPRKIPNKDYYDASKVSLLPIRGIGFEIWTMDQGVLFDNVWLGSDIAAAKKFAKDSYVVKQKTELEREEEENKKAEKEAKDAKDAKKAKTGRMGDVMDKLEDLVDNIESALEPVEAWLIEKGAEPYLEKLISLGVQKPMLVVASVPLILVLFFLIILSGGKKAAPTPPTPAADRAAEKKKTDEPTPDEPTPTEAVENIDDSAAGDEPEKTVRKRRTATAE